MTVDNEMSQSLAMFKCETSYLEILNKINNIVIGMYTYLNSNICV